MLNQLFERQTKGGETHAFQVELKKGEYHGRRVEQKNIDVIISLFDADDKFAGKRCYNSDNFTQRRN